MALAPGEELARACENGRKAERIRIEAIIVAEFRRWSAAEDKHDDQLAFISIGAIGALSNVLAKIHGFPKEDGR